LLYLGLILYLISFFLPAVWVIDHFVSGWRCAFLALGVWLTTGSIDPEYQLGVRLTIFGGLINILAIACAVLSLLRSAPRARLIIALAVVTCIPPMWLSIYLLSAPPYVGHVAWIVGLLLMIFGDISLLGRKRLLRIGVVVSSFLLALVVHGVIISRDPLAQGPNLWGFTLERSRLSGEPMLWGLFREFPSKTSVDLAPFFLAVLVDFITWLVVLVIVSKLIQRLWGAKLSPKNAQ
jgi:hypothetical protein